LRQLLNWRKTQSVIHHGQLMHFLPENGTYVLVRYDTQSRVMVIFNKNASDTPIQLNRFSEVWPAKARATDVITGEVMPLGQVFQAPARSVTILQTTRP
jgi:pullulanase/glycogen debranching enzyme